MSLSTWSPVATRDRARVVGIYRCTGGRLQGSREAAAAWCTQHCFPILPPCPGRPWPIVLSPALNWPADAELMVGESYADQMLGGKKSAPSWCHTYPQEVHRLARHILPHARTHDSATVGPAAVGRLARALCVPGVEEVWKSVSVLLSLSVHETRTVRGIALTRAFRAWDSEQYDAMPSAISHQYDAMPSA